MVHYSSQDFGDTCPSNQKIKMQVSLHISLPGLLQDQGNDIIILIKKNLGFSIDWSKLIKDGFIIWDANGMGSR